MYDKTITRTVFVSFRLGSQCSVDTLASSANNISTAFKGMKNARKQRK